LQAVQTLSRLNRTHPRFPDKRTFVLDFQNTTEDIREAFRPYFEATELEDVSDPNQVYELYDRLYSFGVIDRRDVDRFAETYFRGPLEPADRIRLEGLVRQAVELFRVLEDEGQQEEFRQLLRSYQRFYSFIAQVVTLEDPDLEKMYAYASWLSRFLPDRNVPEQIEITDDMLYLQALRVQETGAEYRVSLKPGETEKLQPIGRFGAHPYTEEEERSLQEITETFNERHGTNFTEDDILRMERINEELLAQDDMVQMLRNNPPDVAVDAYAEACVQALIRRFQRDREMQTILLTDPTARDLATRHFFKRAWRAVHAQRPSA